MPTPATILLADDSPHAQRMGERILREEGYDVITVTDGETAILRVKDADPDIVIVDAFLPQVSGYDLCGFIKKQPQHAHVRVLLTSTALERVDEDQAFRSGADGQLKKPFEASVMLKSLKDLISGSDKDSKKKRSGSTFGLSDPVADEVAVAKVHDTVAADEESRSAEKSGVSPLQAWLEQHGDDDASDTASDPLGLHAETSGKADEPSAKTIDNRGIADAEERPLAVSNPQLLRRPEEEEEDLSLRNNPVVRGLKNAPPPSRAEPELDDRVTQFSDRKSEGAQDAPGVRTIRMKAKPAEVEEEDSSTHSTGDAPKQRRSLLDVLAKYESEVNIDDEQDDPLAASFPEDDTLTSREELAPVADAYQAGHGDEESEERLSTSITAVEVAEGEEAVAPVVDSDEFLEVGRDAENAVDDAAELAAVPSLAAEANDAEPDATVVEVPSPLSAAASATALPVAEAQVVSLLQAGVRLDEEEIRAAVEIAVSASMPAIVEEVTRCVTMVLAARYRDTMDAGEKDAVAE